MATALSLHHSLLLEVSHTFFRNNHNSKDTQIQHVYLVEDSNMNHHLDILRPYQHTHCFHSVLHSLDLEDNLRQRVIEITINLCMLITLYYLESMDHLINSISNTCYWLRGISHCR